MAEWIDVNERLPKKSETVLCYCRNTSTELGTITIGSCNKGWFLQYEVGKTSYPHHYWKVTHWMPLPEPPRTPKETHEKRTETHDNTPKASGADDMGRYDPYTDTFIKERGGEK